MHVLRFAALVLCIRRRPPLKVTPPGYSSNQWRSRGLNTRGDNFLSLIIVLLGPCAVSAEHGAALGLAPDTVIAVCQTAPASNHADHRVSQQ
jgi:hypothetical protein